ncbi:hypothetical protein LCGC14_1311670 [marine sediment metagenome]|uniref:Uncharacterized protein n=1 Tax=marine sediment metagenome TaxID=412755 RepID=A0A0F9KML3_9ZZZZ
MADLINPAGTLGRAFIMGYVDMVGGESSVTVNLPLPGHSAYVAVANAKGWQTTIEVTQGEASFTCVFSTEAPAGGQLRWCILLA